MSARIILSNAILGPRVFLSLSGLGFAGTFIVFNSGDGGISSSSPGLYIAALLLLIYSLSILVKCNYYLSRHTVIDLIAALFLVIYSAAQSYVNDEDIVNAVGRNGFLIITLFLTRYINSYNAKKIFSALCYVFAVEVFIRFYSGAASFDGLYSLKQSIIFPDTNFIGVVIAPVVALLWSFRHHLFLPSLMLILLTASRTAYIGLLALRFSLAFPIISLIGLISGLIILLVFKDIIFLFLYNLDGSLATKIDIFNTSIRLLSDAQSMLWGYGKNGVLEYAIDETGRQLHVGHTLPGNISQYGVVLPISVLLLSLRFLDAEDRVPFFFYLMAVGLSGLFPYAYIGFAAIFYKAAKITIRKNEVSR